MINEDTVELRAKKAAYMRAYYQRVNGSAPVKGVMISCARCSASTEKQHWSHDWCRECVKPAQLERRRRKREAAGSEPLGTVKDCKECGAAFLKRHKRQFYCAPCNELSARDYLPSQRGRVIAYQAARNKERRKTDPTYAISSRISAGISASLKGGKAGRKWETLVGYSIHELMRHLERQFLKGMGWHNRHLWHVDHILPLASFSFDSSDHPDFRAAWSMTNLRPLWSGENIRKSARRTHLL